MAVVASKWFDNHQRQDHWEHEIFIEVTGANHLIGEGRTQLDCHALLCEGLLKDLAKDLATRNIDPDDKGNGCQEEDHADQSPGWHACIEK